MVENNNKGFAIPINSWLRDELYSWSKSLIFDNKINHLVDMNFIRKLFNEHQTKKFDHSGVLWNYLIFHNWYQKYH